MTWREPLYGFIVINISETRFLSYIKLAAKIPKQMTEPDSESFSISDCPMIELICILKSKPILNQDSHYNKKSHKLDLNQNRRSLKNCNLYNWNEIFLIELTQERHICNKIGSDSVIIHNLKIIFCTFQLYFTAGNMPPRQGYVWFRLFVLQICRPDGTLNELHRSILIGEKDAKRLSGLFNDFKSNARKT